MEGLGGNIHSFWAVNSFRISFCNVPLSLDGSENKQTKLVRNFDNELSFYFNLPSVLWDERFSSDVIFKELRKADISKTKIKNKLDQQSASYILQGYLDRYRNNN